jgi:endonuclease/exonuclease/phosphatase family metal-dependent hydrolase
MAWPLGAAALDRAAPAALLPPAPAVAEVSVLTYNVHGLPWPFASGRPKALRQIGDELAAMRKAGSQPGIVLIQEGFGGGMAELIARSGYRYWAAGPQRGDSPGEGARKGVYVGGRHIRYPQKGEGWGKWTGAGLWVLSDYPIVGVAIQPYKSCAGWDCLANKGAMLARIAVPGSPMPIDVVNTHMNSRGAAKTPRSWSLRAYDRQARTLASFIDVRREAEAPLLVGGDFNVRHAPDRFKAIADDKDYAIVARWCAQKGEAACVLAKAGSKTPWLERQDQQAFADGAGARVEPVAAEVLFDGKARLSDHAGYLVRYRLEWGEPAGETDTADTAEARDNQPAS